MFQTTIGKANWFELSRGLKNWGKIIVFEWSREVRFEFSGVLKKPRI